MFKKWNLIICIGYPVGIVIVKVESKYNKNNKILLFRVIVKVRVKKWIKWSYKTWIYKENNRIYKKVWVKRFLDKINIFNLKNWIWIQLYQFHLNMVKVEYRIIVIVGIIFSSVDNKVWYNKM